MSARFKEDHTAAVWLCHKGDLWCFISFSFKCWDQTHDIPTHCSGSESWRRYQERDLNEKPNGIQIYIYIYLMNEIHFKRFYSCIVTNVKGRNEQALPFTWCCWFRMLFFICNITLSCPAMMTSMEDSQDLNPPRFKIYTSAGVLLEINTVITNKAPLMRIYTEKIKPKVKKKKGFHQKWKRWG